MGSSSLEGSTAVRLSPKLCEIAGWHLLSSRDTAHYPTIQGSKESTESLVKMDWEPALPSSYITEAASIYGGGKLHPDTASGVNCRGTTRQILTPSTGGYPAGLTCSLWGETSSPDSGEQSCASAFQKGVRLCLGMSWVQRRGNLPKAGPEKCKPLRLHRFTEGTKACQAPK